MAGRKYTITVEDTGARFPCGEDESVLEAMKKAGCGPILYGCFGGGCGVCKMRVLSGDYRVFKRMSRAHVSEWEEDEGIALICCIKPRENLKIARI